MTPSPDRPSSREATSFPSESNGPTSADGITNGQTRGESDKGIRIVSRLQAKEIVEDNYVQYLIERHAIKSTWKFLGVIGGAVVLLLGYTGVEWKQKRDNFLKEIQDKRDEFVRKFEQDQVKYDAQISTNVALLEKRMQSSEGHLSQAQENARTMKMISDSNSTAYAALHQNVISAGTAAAKAEATVTDFRRIQDDVRRGLDEINTRTGKRLDELDIQKKEIERMRDQAKTLHEQARLIFRRRSSETITLRERQSFTVFMPEPLASNEDRPDVYRAVRFKVNEISSSFKVTWWVFANDGSVIGEGEIPVTKTKLGSDNYEKAHRLGATSFEVVVEYSDSGIIAHDFVSLRVRTVVPDLTTFETLLKAVRG